jgi:hypothetical protein
MNKRGQIALFVIIAVMIIAAVVFFLILRPKIIAPAAEKADVENVIINCMKDEAVKTSDLLIKQGGYSNPDFYKIYNGSKVGYLCYTQEFYKPCINQRPNLLVSLGDEIATNVENSLSKCASTLKTQLEKQGYSASMGKANVTAVLSPDSILINANMTINIEKGNETKRFESFDASVASPLYDFAILASDIVNNEIRYGDFDQQTYMLLHSDTIIEKHMINFDRFYIINFKGKTFTFVVRSFALPPGY